MISKLNVLFFLNGFGTKRFRNLGRQPSREIKKKKLEAVLAKFFQPPNLNIYRFVQVCMPIANGKIFRSSTEFCCNIFCYSCATGSNRIQHMNYSYFPLGFFSKHIHKTIYPQFLHLKRILEHITPRFCIILSIVFSQVFLL